MLHLVFCIVVFIFMLSGANDVKTSTMWDCNVYTPTTNSQQLIPIVSKPDSSYYRPLHVIQCDVEPMAIENGEILKLVTFIYNLECDDYHTLPLGGLSSWNCIAKKSVKSIINRNLHVKQIDLNENGAYECVEKMWPETVYIKRKVSIHNNENCIIQYFSEFIGILNEERSYMIGGFSFTTQFVHQEVECLAIFNSSSGFFQEWVTTLTFRLQHITKYQIIPDTVLDEANCQLGLAIISVAEGLLKAGLKIAYSLQEPDSLFHPGKCTHPGSMVEKEFQSGFKNEVPLCKKCQRGYYLDLYLGICTLCNNYHYSKIQGVLECSPCHNVFANSLFVNMDSMLDCYSMTLKATKSALARSSLFILVFHLTYLMLVIWNVRSYIELMLTKSGSIDESEL